MIQNIPFWLWVLSIIGAVAIGYGLRYLIENKDFTNKEKKHE